MGGNGPVVPLKPGCLAEAVDRSLAAADHVYDPTTDTELNAGRETVFVDALFGTGLTRRFDDDLLEIIGEWTDHCYAHGVAVDMPSGLCSDSGACIGGNWVFSKLLVTFEAPKTGHYLGGNQYDIDRIRTVPLDIDRDPTRPECRLFEEWDLELDERGLFEDGLNKPLRSHKYTHGHALILSGGPGKGGAARLAARGALRIGAGLVTVGCPPDALPETAARLDAIMCRPVADAGAFAHILKDHRLNALCLGPGLGVTDDTRALVEAALTTAAETKPAPPSGRTDMFRALQDPARRVVLDADALTAFAEDPDTLFAMLHEKCVLTPHDGEFARLFPDIAGKLREEVTRGPAYSKLDATREAAERAGCTVLFKGPDTVIATPDGTARINSAHYDRAAPWLATAGSGDVLAGFITGLLARGFGTLDAAATAAWLHVECARAFGPGLIAEDLPEELPRVFRSLGL